MYDDNEQAIVHVPQRVQKVYIHDGQLTIMMNEYFCEMNIKEGDSAYTVINNLRTLANNMAREEGI